MVYGSKCPPNIFYRFDIGTQWPIPGYPCAFRKAISHNSLRILFYPSAFRLRSIHRSARGIAPRHLGFAGGNARWKRAFRLRSMTGRGNTARAGVSVPTRTSSRSTPGPRAAPHPDLEPLYTRTSSRSTPGPRAAPHPDLERHPTRTSSGPLPGPRAESRGEGSPASTFTSTFRHQFQSVGSLILGDGRILKRVKCGGYR